MVAQKFTVFLEPAEEGGYIVKCLELPVATQGETKREALKNIKEAIEGYLDVNAKFDGKTNNEKIEVVVVGKYPEIALSKKEKEEIKLSVREMKKGNYVSLDELKDA